MNQELEQKLLGRYQGFFRRELVLSIIGIIQLATATPAFAHERWVKHLPLAPIQSEIFRSLSSGSWQLIARPVLLFAMLSLIWSLRDQLATLFKAKLGPSAARCIDFIFNTESQDLWSPAARRMIVKISVRIPALVLMYAASTSSLIMPSFPLEGSLNDLFRIVQTTLAIMILGEVALPLVGLSLLALVGFSFAYFGANTAIDILPVLGLSYIYLLMPMKGGSYALHLGLGEVRILQSIIGIAFFLLGVMKIVNFDLTVGVADNYPFVMHDPLIGIFSLGSDPHFAREWWTFGFACSEMLTGMLLATGVFMRPIALFSAAIFTKLMFMDFGWAEVPHIFPIAVLILIGTSSAVRVIAPPAIDLEVMPAPNPDAGKYDLIAQVGASAKNSLARRQAGRRG